MVKIVKFSCHGCHAPAYGCSLPGDNSGSYVLHSDYADMDRRLAELQEAVRWERNAMRVFNEACRSDAGYGEFAWAMENLEKARAEVDRLIGEEK